MRDRQVPRRWILAALGSGSLTALAGCPGDGDSDAGGEDGGRTEGEDGERTEGDNRTRTTDNPPAEIGPSQIFTGEDRVFVVNGYSTSREWPGILQRKLDRYFDGDRSIRVVNTWESGSPIDDWINIDTDERTVLWEENLAPALGQDVPVIALAQQSLQGVYGDYSAGVRGPDDDERIQRGADAIETYARLLLEDGADHAVVATHIYKTGMEPEIGNERLALDALLGRDPEGISRGPDVWTPTRDHHPEAFAADGVHPNTIGTEIMAHHWFARLLELDGREVPPWSRKEMETALEGETDDAVEGEYYVAPDGSDENVGSESEPLETIREGLRRARPGDTVHLAPGEYREEIRTIRSGEPGNPITITGPQDAVWRARHGAGILLSIAHSHIHVIGITLNGLINEEGAYEDRNAYVNTLVRISPLPTHTSDRLVPVDYLEDVVLEPSRIGNAANSMIGITRLKRSSIGGFRLIGPAGMNYHPDVENRVESHVGEIIYIGSGPDDIYSEEYPYPWDDLDRTRDVRIHHIDNSAGYHHSELVDMKIGCENVTVEYCTDRNAGGQTDGVSAGAISPKSRNCTVRWNDIGDCPVPIEFDPFAPVEEVDVMNWAENNEIYGNYIHAYSRAPLLFQETPDGTPKPDDQRVLCGNRIEGADADEYAYATGECGPDVPEGDGIGHTGGQS